MAGHRTAILFNSFLIMVTSLKVSTKKIYIGQVFILEKMVLIIKWMVGYHNEGGDNVYFTSNELMASILKESVNKFVFM